MTVKIPRGRPGWPLEGAVTHGDQTRSPRRPSKGLPRLSTDLRSGARHRGSAPAAAIGCPRVACHRLDTGSDDGVSSRWQALASRSAPSRRGILFDGSASMLDDAAFDGGEI